MNNCIVVWVSADTDLDSLHCQSEGNIILQFATCISFFGAYYSLGMHACLYFLPGTWHLLCIKCIC